MVSFLVIFTIIMVGWPWYYLLSQYGLFTKLSYFVIFKFPFYVTSLISLRAIYWYKTKYQHHQYNLKEFVIGVPIVLLANFGYTAILFFWATNLYDTEIWNGYADRAEYYEAWTEEVETCTTDDDGHRTCTKENVYHPPYWQMITSNGEVLSISQEIYTNYSRHFGTETEVDLYHSGQVSSGDGDMYLSKYDGSREKLIPTAISHPYVNYIRAAEPVFLYTGFASNYKSSLVDYPLVEDGYFGSIYLNRVFAPEVSIPDNWGLALNQTLCNELAFLGKQKQVNALVYITQQDTNFYKALHEIWYGGKKNDVVVILGMNSFPKLDWVRVMSWTDSPLFKEELAKKITNLPDLNDASLLGKTIMEQIGLGDSQGGFLRKPMDEFHELRNDIHLPLMAYFWGILIALGIQMPLLVIFIAVDIE